MPSNEGGSIASTWIVLVRAWDSFFVPFLKGYSGQQAIFGSSIAARKFARQLQKTGRYEEIYITLAACPEFPPRLPTAPIPHVRRRRGRGAPPGG